MTMVRRQIARPPRRPRQWGIFQNSLAIAAAAQASNAVADLGAPLETALGYNLNNVTVSAIRLRMDFGYTVGSSIGDLTRLSYGILWVNNDAVTIGPTAMPDPGLDDADWIAHGGASFISDSVVAHRPRFSSVFINNNSMRKQRENFSSLMLIISIASFSFNVGVHITGRTLFLLP